MFLSLLDLGNGTASKSKGWFSSYGKRNSSQQSRAIWLAVTAEKKKKVSLYIYIKLVTIWLLSVLANAVQLWSQENRYLEMRKNCFNCKKNLNDFKMSSGFCHSLYRHTLVFYKLVAKKCKETFKIQLLYMMHL